MLQLFYCEQRKPLVPVHSEDFTMPGWLSMLLGTESTEVCSWTCSEKGAFIDAVLLCGLVVFCCESTEQLWYARHLPAVTAVMSVVYCTL